MVSTPGRVIANMVLAVAHDTRPRVMSVVS